MKRSTFLLSLFALGMGACGDPPTTGNPSGALSFSLTGAGSDGALYRLRNATFKVSGYDQWGPYYADAGGAPSGQTNFSVSTEEDPNAAEIVRKVPPGSYVIDLTGDWYMEKITTQGVTRVQQVVLLSDRTQYTYVWDGGVARVSYRIGVDGTLIDFRSGDLAIDIDVVRPEDKKSPRYPDASLPTDGPRATPDAGVFSTNI